MEFIDLRKQYETIQPMIQKRLNAVLQHGKFIMGPEITELEQKLAAYVGCKYCVSCASGTDALLLGLMANEIGPGDAVFTAPFTFIATAEVICLLGATPVFVDIDANTFNMDPEKLDEAIARVEEGDRRTRITAKKLNPRGVITVDLFGLPAEYDQINRTAKQHNLFVVEDAAQSFGGTYKGRKVGSLADVAATSFFPAKPFGCYGDGGAIFTDDEAVHGRLRSLREHGKGTHKYDNVRIGINGRLDTMQAAVLLAKWDVFDDELNKRQEIAKRYSKMLADSVKVPSVPAGLLSAWAQYSVVSDEREAMMDRLREKGIPTAIYYPKPLHMQTAFEHLGYREGAFPVAEYMSKRIFSLPMHPYLEEDDQRKIASVLKKS